MPTPMRKRPDDFEAMLDKMGWKQMCRHYRVGPTVLTRWRRESGFPTKRVTGIPPRPMPEDFPARAGVEFNLPLSLRYGVHVNTITRWRKESGIASPGTGGGPIKPVPPGFIEAARVNGNIALAEMFSAGSQTITRWRKETGAYFVKPRRFKEPKEPKERIAREPKKRKLSTGFLSKVGKPHQSIVPPRDGSIEGDAAQVLRAYAPVYRCDERGRQSAPHIAKRFWRYGATVLSPDELMERARAKGWACKSVALGG